MDETVVPLIPHIPLNSTDTNQTIGANPGDFCFVCKVFFDRNLKKSRRRILRDRDDLVSPLLLLLWTAQRTGTWFSANDMYLNAGPLDQSVTQHLQQMFACRKCFERVIKLERDVQNFETEMCLMLDQSCDTLLGLDIIRGDVLKVKQLQNQMQTKTDTKGAKRRKMKTKKKVKVLPKKKKKAIIETTDQTLVQTSQPQQHFQKTKQILLLAKSQEGDEQQLLVLQVPANDTDDSESNQIHYNPTLDHHYHNDEHSVFLSSNAIPVTTCVTVASDEQLLEVQLEQNSSEHNQQIYESNDEREATELDDVRGSDEEEQEDIEMRDEDQNIDTIPAEEKDWAVYGDGVIVVNESNFKRKVESIEKTEELLSNKSEEDENEIIVKKKNKKSKESYTKRTYSPRSSSPLPPAGESKVVVQLLYGSKQWKRTMDGDIKSIIRDMALRRPDPAGRKIAASEKLCSAVMKNYSKRLVSECKEGARTIRVADHQDITQLDIKSFTSEVFLKCPKTANLIKSLIPIEPRDTLDEHGATALIMGVILYMHSMQSNTLQHILSYVLRRSGCNREGFKTLHSLGLTLSYTSVLKIMNDIDAKPDIEKSSLDTIERSIDSVVVRTKTESKSETKKKCAQVVTEPQEGENVLLQFTLPYYQTTSAVTYTTNQLTGGQTTYTTVPFDGSESTVVYNTQ